MSFSMSFGPNRAKDNHREGPGGLPRMMRKRLLNLNSDSNSTKQHDEKNNVNDAPSSGNNSKKRHRSQEPEPGNSTHESGKDRRRRGSGGSPFKRAKVEEDEIEEVPDSSCNSPEPDMAAPVSPTPDPPTTSPTLDMNPKHKIQLGPGFNLFARAVRESLPGTQTQKSKEELRAARDIASKFQFDLECLQKERDALKKRVSELEEGEQKARRQLHISQANESRPPDLAADLETVTRGLQDCKEQLSDSRQATARLKSACERLHFKNEELQSTNKELQGGISKARERIEVLTRENNALGSQLKSRRHSQAKNQDPSIDVFSSRLDQVSEASVKSGVESLNDTLDSFVMEIMDKAEQLVDKHAHLARRPSDRDRRDNAPPLLCALAQPSLTDENRGLLLDAQLHDQLNTELHELFFSNDVISSRMESNGIVQAISEELLRREPWTVVQRWRAITAMGVFALMNESHFAQSTAHQAENIIGLIAQTHGLTPTQFEDMSDSLSSGLRALYKEANELSVVVKRDVLSVRMTITSVVATRFDPTAAASVWPEMGAVAGDEIVGRYKFGLMKRTENGERFDLIKPEVATTALIREICKNS